MDPLMISSWCFRKNWTHSSHANGLKVFFPIIVTSRAGSHRSQNSWPVMHTVQLQQTLCIKTNITANEHLVSTRSTLKKQNYSQEHYLIWCGLLPHVVVLLVQVLSGEIRHRQFPGPDQRAQCRDKQVLQSCFRFVLDVGDDLLP